MMCYKLMTMLTFAVLIVWRNFCVATSHKTCLVFCCSTIYKEPANFVVPTIHICIQFMLTNPQFVVHILTVALMCLTVVFPFLFVLILWIRSMLASVSLLAPWVPAKKILL